MSIEDNLVSVIMPLYNSEKYIDESLKSLINQSYQNWEAIVIDDFSTDSSYDIVFGYSKIDSRIHVSKNSYNIGAALTRNKCIDIANGRFIAFLDSDDIWHPKKLKIQINFMLENKYSFTNTSYGKIDENSLKKKYIIRAKGKMLYEDLLIDSPGNLTVIYDSKVLGKFHIEDVKKRNDYLMWLKVIKKAKILHGIDNILAFHRIREGSISSNKFLLIKHHWHIYRKIEKISLIKSIYVLVIIITKGIIRKLIWR